MKKLLFAAGVLASFIGYSQDPYFSAHLGYGLGFPGETGIVQTGDTVQTTFTTKTIRMGGGINGGASFGFIIDDGVGVDFALAYQNNLGQSLESTYQTLSFDNNFNPIIVTVTDVTKYSSWSARFTPSLRLEMSDAEIRPFAQVGPTVMFSGFTVTEESSSQNNETVMKEKYSANLTIGGTATAGVEFEIARDIMLTTAIQFVTGYSSPKKSEVTEATSNGQSVLDQMSTSQKETEYEKEFTNNNLAPGDPDQPSKFFRVKYDYGSINLLVGIRVILD